MNLPVVFRPEADHELLMARRWYDEHRPGLGAQFASEIDDTVERISSNPLAFPLVQGKTRRAIVRRFPFGIYFRMTPAGIVVTAMMHGRRHPLRWQLRR